WPAARPLGVWILVTFVWSYYGTTVPWGWVPLQRDPRYVAVLVVPVAALLGCGLARLRPRVAALLTALLVLQGVAAAGLEVGPAIRSPHRAFLRSPIAPQSTLEPFEFFAARWEAGLDSPVPFRCADNVGRDQTVRLLRYLPGTAFGKAESSCFVFSPVRRTD